LEYLPKEMAIDAVHGLYRMGRSVSFPNAASGNKFGDIVLYDNAFEGSKNLARIVAHEIAHRMFDSLSDEDKDGYRIYAEWLDVNTTLSKGPKYFLTRQKTAEPDSSNSDDEDFSNNIEHFLFNPKKLFETSPKVYEWIARRFGDKFKIGKGRP
jgi:hypothetical protein